MTRLSAESRVTRRELLAGSVLAASGLGLGPRTSRAETDVSLREIAEPRGATVSASININHTVSHRILVEQFSDITDVTYVWSYEVNKDPDREYNFYYPDRTAKMAADNDQTVTGLHLAWGWPGRVPDHVLQQGYGPQQIDNLLRHTEKLVEFGKGRVRVWSAINEPTGDDGAFKAEDFWVQNSSWSNGLYPDYIPLVLLKAHEVDPEATLLINNFDTQSHYNRFGGWNVRADADYYLIAQLQQDSRLLSTGFDFSKLAYGTQFHIMDASIYPDEPSIGWMAEQVQLNLERFRDGLGVEVYVTEMDVKVHNVPGDLDAKYLHQSLIYAYGVRAALAAGVRHIGIWGVMDSAHGDNWTPIGGGSGSGGPTSDPTLFDGRRHPKPAFFAVRDEIEKLPEVS